VRVIGDRAHDDISVLEALLLEVTIIAANPQPNKETCHASNEDPESGQDPLCLVHCFRYLSKLLSLPHHLIGKAPFIVIPA
jgi:hypothetical protein